jgi:hypothetical protein
MRRLVRLRTSMQLKPYAPNQSLAVTYITAPRDLTYNLRFMPQGWYALRIRGHNVP